MKPTLRYSLCIAAAWLLAGCSAAPTGPMAAATSSPASARAADVPEFTNVVVRYADGLLQVAATAAAPAAMAPFDAERSGGWCFQLFIDADQSGTGYGQGIDYLVRAIEVIPGGGVDVRLAEGGGGPGGWGEAVGRVAFSVSGGRLDCSIPLSILGPDDGAIDFVLETYRTIRLPEEQGGRVKHEFVENYSGVSVPFARRAGVARRGLVAVAHDADRAH